MALDAVSGVASQGKSLDDALANFREAFALWSEHAEPWEKERARQGEPVATMVLELEA